MEADAYFFYLKNEGYAGVAVNSKYNSSRNELKEYLSEKGSSDRVANWFYDTIDDHKWLIYITSIQNYYYGFCFNLNIIEEKINDSLTFMDAAVIISDTEYIPQERSQKLITIQSAKAKIFAHVLCNEDEIMGQIPLAQQVGSILALIYICSIPCILLLLRRILISPLNQLNMSMNELEMGNSKHRMSQKGINRETQELFAKFNSMADRLAELKIKVYEKELEKMDIEATNLRLQVNPHFILNCLNIIFSLNKSGKSNQISIFTKYLADYLRFSLWHTNGLVTIKDEIKCVNNYIQIQKIRFPEVFTYISDMEEEIMLTRIPALLILNFVENATKYALRMDSEIEIIVIARQDGEAFQIPDPNWQE